MNPRAFGAVFLLLGVLACAAALADPRLTLPGLGLGALGFFLAGTLLGNAYRIARTMRPLVGRPLTVEVFGDPLGPPNLRFQIDKLSAFGAGLLIHLRPMSGGPRILLKIAQPRSATFDGTRLEIARAASATWAGVRAPRKEGAPAVLVIATRQP